jgi:hypothetical protein
MELSNILIGLVPIAFAVLFIGLVVWIIRKAIKGIREGMRVAAEQARKNEALYQSMFPDLQPHFHPKGLHEFTKAWRARASATEPYTWMNPPGFAGAAKADVLIGTKGELVRLFDAAGALLTEFALAQHNEGANIRVGQGKFTVNTKDRQDDRVRYWHPNREFKWTRIKGWRFTTPVSDRSIDSNDSGTSYSSSSTSTAGAAAAAAGVAGLGGAFDGGGASAGWDGGGGATNY